jgi:hypothetical protein
MLTEAVEWLDPRHRPSCFPGRRASHQRMIEKLLALNSNAIKPGADLAVDIPSIGHD